ncbi:MAG TPA: hypothetical protein VKR52_19110, partial [Terracidiphilus sp.]|nr:hypothetical protein [Terracidiphilus sp.]
MTALLSCVALLPGVASAQNQKPFTTWATFGGSPEDSNYSALTQINRSNVTKLQVAWKYDSGDQIGYTFAPIVVDNVL